MENEIDKGRDWEAEYKKAKLPDRIFLKKVLQEHGLVKGTPGYESARAWIRRAMHRTRDLDKRRERYWANVEREREADRKFRERNKDRLNALARERYAEDEKIRIASASRKKAQYVREPEEKKRKWREWYAKNQNREYRKIKFRELRRQYGADVALPLSEARDLIRQLNGGHIELDEFLRRYGEALKGIDDRLNGK